MSSFISSRWALFIPIATGSILFGIWQYLKHHKRVTHIMQQEQDQEKRAALYAVGAYTKLSSLDITSILSQYSLGSYISHKELNGGLSNSNYRVDVQLNGTIQPVLLKVCDNKTRDELLSQIAALLVFRQHDLSLSYPIARSDTAYLTIYNAKNVILYDWLDGATPSRATSTIMSELASALAAVHKVLLSQFEGLPEFPMGISEMRPFLETEVKTSSVSSDPFISWLTSHLPTFTQLEHDTSLPWGVLHGDLFLENVMFQDEICVGLIDFEEMCRGPLMLDVAMTLVGCAYDESNILNMDFARTFLHTYHSHRPITSHERLLFPSFLAYACGAIAFWRFRQFNVRVPNEQRKQAHICMMERANEAFQQATMLCELIPQ